MTMTEEPNWPVAEGQTAEGYTPGLPVIPWDAADALLSYVQSRYDATKPTLDAAEAGGDNASKLDAAILGAELRGQQKLAIALAKMALRG